MGQLLLALQPGHRRRPGPATNGPQPVEPQGLPAQRQPAGGRMTRTMTLLLALTCGAAVGNIYFPQAISPLVAQGLGVPPTAAALVVTAAQLGYAAGIFLLVPLGDRLPHRPLIATLLGLTGLGLVAASTASTLPHLVGTGIFVGITTVIAPIL